MKKILFIAHGHPDISKGGAEIAAWNLFEKCKEEGIEALFIARDAATPHTGSAFSIRAKNEIILHSAIDDWFSLTNKNAVHVFGDLKKLVRQFKPDVIHVHHYSHIGMEMFPTLRQAAPEARILLTLHEYMAICLHNGTMVKFETNKLCYKSSPSDCNRCFPGHSPGDFFLRKQFIMDQFSYVDHFISPSEFLKSRYIDWGIPENKISVIENYLPNINRREPRTLAEGEKRTRFAYFGQITPFKGLDVLLSAILLIPKPIRRTLSLEIHGANINAQSDEYQANIRSLLKKCDGIVTMRGAYESHQLPDLMAQNDWIVMPSIWWENSPVVIQEAIAVGRPLIVADIGGMKEKVEGKAGLTFSAKSAASLAGMMQEAVCEEVFDFWVGALSCEVELFGRFEEVYRV